MYQRAVSNKQRAASSESTPTRNRTTCSSETCTITIRHATLRHATPRHATPRYATPRYATPRHARDNGIKQIYKGVNSEPMVYIGTRRIWKSMLTPANTIHRRYVGRSNSLPVYGKLFYSPYLLFSRRTRRPRRAGDPGTPASTPLAAEWADLLLGRPAGQLLQPAVHQEPGHRRRR